MMSTLAPVLLALSACVQPQPAPTTGQAGSIDATAVTPAAGSAVSAAELRERAAALLIAVAGVPTTDSTAPEENALRANAIEGLLPLPGRLEPILRTALADRSIGIRAISAIAAGKARIKGLTDNLRPLLSDEALQVRAGAIYALSRLNAGVDPTPLAGMLNAPEPSQRALAAFVLGELGNASAVPMLMSASAAPAGSRADPSSDRIMRLQIAEALIKLGKNEAIDEVRAALYPSRPDELEACALAVQILGQVKDRGSRAQLLSLTSERYDNGNPMPPEIRLAAAASLCRIGDQTAVPLAERFATDPLPAVRAQAATVIGESGDRARLPLLATFMADAEPRVRIAAAAAVLKITDAK